MAKYPTRKRIYSLVGESHRNADGSSRQGILKGCVPGEPVELRRQSDNPHDPNAILVTDEIGRGLGFIAREDAMELAPALDGGQVYSAQIHELVGGVQGFESLGCRICITWEGQKRQNCKPLRPEQVRYEHAPLHLNRKDRKTRSSDSSAEANTSAPTVWETIKGCASLFLLIFMAFLVIRSCSS